MRGMEAITTPDWVSEAYYVNRVYKDGREHFHTEY